ncbi:MAG: hypothetical protein NXH83_14730 [Rhodobacteraceae bacterium]|nr:hypothetical protein [Paracoccaceae bacterium]
MFDVHSNDIRCCGLSRARCFFAEHGHQLATAAALLGGAAAEARVVSCAIRLDGCMRIDRRLKQDLHALHRLLALEDIPDPDDPNGGFLPALDPASQDIELICLLTDMLQDLLSEVEDTIGRPTRAVRPSAA